jgi:hypothetical protein
VPLSELDLEEVLSGLVDVGFFNEFGDDFADSDLN